MLKHQAKSQHSLIFNLAHSEMFEMFCFFNFFFQSYEIGKKSEYKNKTPLLKNKDIGNHGLISNLSHFETIKIEKKKKNKKRKPLHEISSQEQTSLIIRFLGGKKRKRNRNAKILLKHQVKGILALCLVRALLG